MLPATSCRSSNLEGVIASPTTISLAQLEQAQPKLAQRELYGAVSIAQREHAQFEPVQSKPSQLFLSHNPKEIRACQ